MTKKLIPICPECGKRHLPIPKTVTFPDGTKIYDVIFCQATGHWNYSCARLVEPVAVIRKRKKREGK